MLETPKAVMRRSRILLALACWIPALLLAALNFTGTIGFLWKLLQIALMLAGMIIFWRETQRVRKQSSVAETAKEAGDTPTN